MRRELIVIFALLLCSTSLFAKDNKLPKGDLLIRQLDSESYDTREEATEMLIELSISDKTVFDKIKFILKTTKNEEVKYRANYIVKKVESIQRREVQRIEKPSWMPSLKEISPENYKVLDLSNIFKNETDNDLAKLMDDISKGKKVNLDLLVDKAFNPKIICNGNHREVKAPLYFHKSGIASEQVSELLRSHIPDLKNEGFVILAIKKGSYADKAGLKKHDIVISFNGKTVKYPSEIEDIQKGIKALVLRKGNIILVKLPKWKGL